MIMIKLFHKIFLISGGKRYLIFKLSFKFSIKVYLTIYLCFFWMNLNIILNKLIKIRYKED